MASFNPIQQTIKYDKFRDPRTQIRILHVKAGTFDDDIHSTLEVVSLDDCPRYHALSYYWGDLTELVQISVDEIQFNVTLSQQQAIRHLREIGVLHLWIDGVCIDQHDLIERAAQVETMANVYRRAFCVHVWLGTLQDATNWIKEEEADFSNRLKNGEWAVDDDSILWSVAYPQNEEDPDLGSLLINIENLQVTFSSDPCVSALAFSQMDDDSSSSGDSLIISKDWFRTIALLNYILSREWWTRVWVLQEVMLASSPPIIQIGRHQLELSVVSMIVKHLRKYSWESPAHRDCCGEYVEIASKLGITRAHDASLQAGDIGHLLNHAGQSLTMEDVYYLSRKRYATDPSDYVYAMLGMLDVGTARLVPVNYYAGDDRTCAIATLALFHEAKNLYALRFAAGKRLARHEPLSWMIYWSSSSTLSENRPCPIFRAHGNTEYRPSSNSDVGRSVVSGCIIDSISWRDGYRTEYHKGNWPDVHESLKIWSRRTRISLDRPTRRVWNFWRVIFKDNRIHLDLHKQGIAPRVFGDGGLLEQKDLEEIHQHWDVLNRATTSEHRGTNLWRNAIWQQDFFLTTQGSMASTNSAVNVGDVCCILQGCYAPVLLRPTNARGEYQFVGLAYVEGWMWGERLNEHTQWQDLTLV